MDIIVFSSELHDIRKIMAEREDALRSAYSSEEIVFHTNEEEFEPEGEVFCFIATGGTEEMFVRRFGKHNGPFTLLCDGYHNSLAAAFEIATYLEQHGVQHHLVNLPLNIEDHTPTPLIDTLYFNRFVMQDLAQARIGLIGKQSSWLVASSVDTGYVTYTYGAQFIEIDIQELIDTFKATPKSESDMDAATYSRKALNEAHRMYLALKQICSKYRLSALTIRCFDLLGTCRTTACYALARLNTEGIVAGCEGDIPALWTMMVARGLTSRAAFMANPSSTNPSERTVDFAHCTIPLSMAEGFSFPSHFESGTGIGVAALVPTGPCKIMKIGGMHLDKLYQAEGEIICNTNIAERCRTQVSFRFRSRGEFDRFMASRLGNHVILYR